MLIDGHARGIDVAIITRDGYPNSAIDALRVIQNWIESEWASTIVSAATVTSTSPTLTSAVARDET